MNEIDFAERLNDLMIENGLTPKALGEAVGIDRTTVTRYLSGVRFPAVDTMVSIANYFNCTTDYLLTLQDLNQERTFKQCPPFEKQFKILLKHFKTSRYKLCANSEIAASLLDKWYHGQYQPSVYNVIRLSKFFDCSVDYVLGRVDYE